MINFSAISNFGGNFRLQNSVFRGQTSDRFWTYTSGFGQISQFRLWTDGGGGPRVVVSTAAFHARVRGSVPGLGGLKETKMFLPNPRVKVSIMGSLRDREVACSASDRQGSNFESCVWRTVSSQSSHHPQEVLLAQFSLYVHKGGLKPDSFHFILDRRTSDRLLISDFRQTSNFGLRTSHIYDFRQTLGRFQTDSDIRLRILRFGLRF